MLQDHHWLWGAYAFTLIVFLATTLYIARCTDVLEGLFRRVSK